MSVDLETFIRDIPDFPEPGVVFKDITPLLGDHGALRCCIDGLVAPHRDTGITKVVGIEARGFILAAPAALDLGAGFVPVRKPNKLPWTVEGVDYDLEYGTDRVEVHADAITPGERVLVIDDVLATGGTAAATIGLVEALGAEVVGVSFLLELGFLDGRRRLGGTAIRSLVTVP